MRPFSLLSIVLFLSIPSLHSSFASLCGDWMLPQTGSANSLREDLSFPKTDAQVKKAMLFLSKTPYGPVMADWAARGIVGAGQHEKEKLFRMVRKAKWRMADADTNGVPELRIKMLTNRDRLAHEMGKENEHPDPAANLEILSGDPLLKLLPHGMPAGSYAMSSGDWAFYYPSTRSMLHNETPTPVRLVYQQVTQDGRVVEQSGAYSASNSSWGWDGRFEIQPDSKDGLQLVVTQGAMELPVNLQGAARDARLLPEVGRDNEFRARHVFKVQEWIPGKDGEMPALVLRDQGTILNFNPTTERRYIQRSANGKLLHAHGYGETFVPDPKDARKMYVDPNGRTWRFFDMVTRETTIKDFGPDGQEYFRYIPTETKTVAVAMDKKNPFKQAQGEKMVFITSNHFPGTDTPVPATVRYAYNTHGTAIEQREILEDGTVAVMTENVPQNAPALLTEGFNLAEKTVNIEGTEYYIGTNSAGEYTSGGLPTPDQKLYGTYLWFRPAKNGPIGPFEPVFTADGKNFKDMFREVTQMYGGSWGIGRAQIFTGGDAQLWVKAHMHDVDLLPEDLERFPHSGYPREGHVFTDAYRRHQVEFPVRIIKRNERLVMEIADPQVESDLAAWRERHPSIQH